MILGQKKKKKTNYKVFNGHLRLDIKFKEQILGQIFTFMTIDVNKRTLTGCDEFYRCLDGISCIMASEGVE